MPQARRFVVRGRVTGVGFRAYVYDHAIHEGIGGFARNLPDRSLEVVAEGEAEAMQRFEMALRQGPPASRVDDVDVEDLPATGRQRAFIIKG